ncbi:MAG: MATE family efflux transporter, partial [Bacteroidaceae bacterium]|nr:MATE family efflux transporter [Bacteroidaceae bacterium]
MALFGKENGTSYLLQMIRDGKELTLQQQILLAVMLSIPSILSQMSNVVMSYIDASMVGSLGAEASASVGLMSTTIWLCSGLCASVSTSFAVQVAHMMGANNRVGAREIFRQAITVCLAFGIFLGSITIAISGQLPVWLGG